MIQEILKERWFKRGKKDKLEFYVRLKSSAGRESSKWISEACVTAGDLLYDFRKRHFDEERASDLKITGEEKMDWDKNTSPKTIRQVTWKEKLNGEPKDVDLKKGDTKQYAARAIGMVTSLKDEIKLGVELSGEEDRIARSKAMWEEAIARGMEKEEREEKALAQVTVECKPPAQGDGEGLIEVASESADQYNRNAMALALENSMQDIGQEEMDTATAIRALLGTGNGLEREIARVVVMGLRGFRIWNDKR